MERVLILVRHGEAGEPSVYWGLQDVRLSAEGVRTAGTVAAAISSVGARAVMSSPQPRAVETATIIAGVLGIAVAVDERLAAKDYGDLTGQAKEIVRARRRPYSTLLDRWHWTAPNGESYSQVAGRVLSFLSDHWLGATDPLVVVTHESVLKVFSVLCEGSLTPIDRSYPYGHVQCYQLASQPVLVELETGEGP